jgi:hypothetical protein
MPYLQGLIFVFRERSKIINKKKTKKKWVIYLKKIFKNILK